jgi:hypothetical protein
VRTVVHSRKEPKGESEALALARGADRIVAVKGAKVAELDLTAKSERAEILGLMLGPSGGLRAPTFIVGRTVYVGFPRAGGFEGL